jgi:hypothetical protein
MSTPKQDGAEAAVVPVISAWASKINWAVLVSMLATLLAIWNVKVPAEVQTNLVAGIMAFCLILDGIIFVFRTFFTKSVTPQSVKDAPVIVQPVPQPVGLMARPSVQAKRIAILTEELDYGDRR